MNAHDTSFIPTEAQPMSAEQRSLLRRAVCEHHGWKAYRGNHGFSMDQLNNQKLWTAAIDLGLNPVTIINSQSEHHKPRPFDKEAVDKLERRLTACYLNMAAKEHVLCFAILDTIRDKQGGRATVKQFAKLDQIITKAEAESSGKSNGEAAGTFEAPKAVPQPETTKTAPEAPKSFLKPAAAREELLRQLLQPQLDEEAITALVQAKVNEALSGVPAIRIEVRQGQEVKTLDGHHHPMFATLLKAASSRMANGIPPSIWLTGPAGSGKTHAAHNVAKALGLPWQFNGALSMPHELLGFIDAGGTYHRTPFREAYEHGGVYLFDEVDGSDNSALLALNAALANGVATFPDTQVQRHKDCIIIATANTWGLGATSDYVGRAKIDAAFLSRFPVRIGWDYDSALEVAVSGNVDFARRVIAARERARTAGLKVVIDPRMSQAGAALIAAGISYDLAAELTYLANLTKEQRKTVEGR
jgi:hypothetical protein